MVLGPTQRVITGFTWDDPIDSENAYYPIVFGTPGLYSDLTGAPLSEPASPALVVEDLGGFTYRAVIAAHEVEAPTVALWNNAKNLGFPATVSLGTDNLGQPVSLAEFPAPAPLYDPGDELVVVWDAGGGLWNDRRTAPRTGAGELITYFLRLSTLETDAGTWRSLSPELDQQFKFSGYVDEPCSAWDYIEDNILPLLPVSVFSTGEGVSVAYWRREAIEADIVGTVSTGGGVARVGPITYEKQDILNDIRLNYALSLKDRQYKVMNGVVGDREAFPAEEVGRVLFSSSFSRASYLSFGTHADSLTSDIIYETATATNVLEWLHRAHAFPHRVAKYDVPIRLGFLRRGNLVLLQDPEVHLEHVCFVRDIAWLDGRPRLSLVIIEDPPRDDRGI